MVESSKSLSLFLYLSSVSGPELNILMIPKKQEQNYEIKKQKQNSDKKECVGTMFDLSLREWIKYVKFSSSSLTRNRDVHSL